MVKIYACKKATSTSINVIKNDNTKDNAIEPPSPIDSLNVYMIAIKLITTICPADMFANKRTSSENGLIKNVRVEGDDAQGARLVVTVNDARNKRVRLMRFSAPHQIMINVSNKQAIYDKRAVHYTSASLYKA